MGQTSPPRPPLQHLERGCSARIGALNVALDCGFRRNDGRQGAVNRAPTKNYACQPVAPPPTATGDGAMTGAYRFGRYTVGTEHRCTEEIE